MTKVEQSFFGTDGIRGRVGNFPITADFMLKLGWAVGSVIARRGGKKVVIGKDTRISGYMIESALEAGLAAAGIESYLLGPMPTPAIAHITRAFNTDLGIVISASHNSYLDNGVKFFSSDGFKISREMEAEIEQLFREPMVTASAPHVGRARRLHDMNGRYIEFCKASLPHHTNFRGMKIVVDCANGASYHIAPYVFSELGAEVITINATPNGLNINDYCGSNHPEVLSARVLAEKADLGIALDGDADRLIMVDHMGEILDGDELLYIITKGLLGASYFSGGIVGTVMSNQGLEVAIGDLGLAFVRVPVGDQHIIQELKQRNWVLGGEPSGHITYLHVNTTADGIIAALQVLQSMKSRGVNLHDAREGVVIYPQKLTSVKMEGPRISLDEGKVGRAIEHAKLKLGERGRVIVRYSGTEPVIRVMVEGEDVTLVNQVNEEICEALKG
jgi:phosphoglucosamine mutase